MGCKVYIDEAGDLGANRGTKWFVLTGVIVREEDERSIRDTLGSIRSKFNFKSIHWRDIKDFYRRSYIVKLVSREKFTYVNVLFDTTKYDQSKLPNKEHVYNFMCKYLLERASWFLHEMCESAEIILSSRGTSRDKELVDYIADKLIPYPGNNIEKVFTGVTAKQAATWDMLQLADICATSMFNSFEENYLGFITPCHVTFLKDKLYSRGGHIEKFGIKYFSDEMKPSRRPTPPCTKK